MAIHTPPPAPLKAPLGETAALAASGMGEAIMEDGAAAIKGAQAGSQEMVSWGRKAFQTNVAAWQALMGCKSPKEALAVHARLFQDHLSLLQENSRRIPMAFWKTTFRKPDADV